MKRDFQKEMEHMILSECSDGKRPSLFLHACCAPCASASLERLVPFFDITLFYYNPNIYPKAEYSKREEEFKRLLSAAGLFGSVKFIAAEYDENEFFAAAKGLEAEPEGGMRCTECFSLRLENTANRAKEEGADFFATTLTISPHKNAVIINSTGEKMAEKYGIRWLPTDLKKKDGYLRSIRLSEEYGLYRQGYCGCRFSVYEH